MWIKKAGINIHLEKTNIPVWHNYEDWGVLLHERSHEKRGKTD